MRVTSQVASMSGTIIETIADLFAVEAANPFITFLLFASFGARNRLFDLATVTARRNFDVAGTTETFMTRSFAIMLAAWH